MKYNQYDIEDFLADQDFIRWVKNESAEPDHALHEWLSQEPANKEKALLAKAFLRRLQRDGLTPTQAEKQEGLEKLIKTNKQTRQPIEKQVAFTPSHGAWRGVAAAAALLLVAFLAYTTLFYQSSDLDEPEYLAANDKLIEKKTAYG